MSRLPEDLVLGKPMYFATAHPFATGAVPLLVKSDQFRPIKVDGNPEHPYNQGSSDLFTQGTLLDFYDPDRSQHATYRGENREWAEFAEALRMKVAGTKDGTGIYFLSETITSPTLARQWKAVQAAYPKATLVQYDPAIAGTALQNGPAVQYDLADADVIVSLDADFLSGASYPGFHKLVRDYAKRRKSPENLNRLYAIESTPTTTGLKAEHRLGLRASEIPAFAAALAAGFGCGWGRCSGVCLDRRAEEVSCRAGQGSEGERRQERRDSGALPGCFGGCAGCGHQLCAGQRWQDGDGLRPSRRSRCRPDQIADFKSLVSDLNAGKVDWLVILNANPIYSAPADLEFASAFDKVNIVAHLGSHLDETGQISHWHHSRGALSGVVVGCAVL